MTKSSLSSSSKGKIVLKDSLFVEDAGGCLADFSRRVANRRACISQGCLFCRRCPGVAGNDCARVTHATSRWRRAPGDEGNYWLLHLGLDVGGSFLLGRATDLA